MARQIVRGKHNRTILVVLSPLVQLPQEMEKLFVVIEHELPNGCIHRIELHPTTALHMEFSPFIRTHHCVHESALNPCWTKINQLAVLAAAEKEVIEQLRFIFTSQSRTRLELVYRRAGCDQVDNVRLRKL